MALVEVAVPALTGIVGPARMPERVRDPAGGPWGTSTLQQHLEAAGPSRQRVAQRRVRVRTGDLLAHDAPLAFGVEEQPVHVEVVRLDAQARVRAQALLQADHRMRRPLGAQLGIAAAAVEVLEIGELRVGR